ncbi:amidohydrolase [Alkalihalobacillus sp. LMS39]|uniref:M20 metallopeptidase family protein n=1 Tax=Alkalihalobacillus sp. LMS39 TaxID=2924032 RepID=UPI001FB2337B|nr:amidohydrolase [Alkalihalobacillus sp. LMS39]UOE92237.1 amidohydrolase [Alkalihalobacillus sp. LMS39]
MNEIENLIFDEAKKIGSLLIKWRRHFHEYPELSFKEWKTALFVEEQLKSIPGMTVSRPNAIIPNVVGKLANGTGPTIAIRADMDALPIQEENDVVYASKHRGIMHACGHDAHTAIVLGVAKVIAQLQDHFQGTIVFLFQSAEETTDEQNKSGACYLLEDGVLDDVDAAIALHMCPWLPVGHMQVHDGSSMANVDVFEGTIRGSGGHGAYPHEGSDPIWMLQYVLSYLYSIPSRKISPLEKAVVSVGEIQAGTSDNIIPTKVKLRGTIRSYEHDIRKCLTEEVTKAFALVAALGGEYDVHITRNEPALQNDTRVNQLIVSSIHDLFPQAHIHHKPFGLGGEDFGYISGRIPSSMFFLGCQRENEKKRELHTPQFDIDEQCLVQGTSILAATAFRYLNEEGEK